MNTQATTETILIVEDAPAALPRGCAPTEAKWRPWCAPMRPRWCCWT
jgi:hypothetical protein